MYNEASLGFSKKMMESGTDTMTKTAKYLAEANLEAAIADSFTELARVSRC